MRCINQCDWIAYACWMFSLIAGLVCTIGCDDEAATQNSNIELSKSWYLSCVFFRLVLRLLPDRMRSGAWMVAIVLKTFGVWPSECLNNETPIGIGVLGRWWSICRHCAIHAFRSTNTQSKWFMIHFVSNVSNHCQSDKPSCYTSPRVWRVHSNKSNKLLSIQLESDHWNRHQR